MECQVRNAKAADPHRIVAFTCGIGLGQALPGPVPMDDENGHGQVDRAHEVRAERNTGLLFYGDPPEFGPDEENPRGGL